MHKLGIIGQPSDWLISSHVDPERAKELGIELINIDIQELADLGKADSNNPPRQSLKPSFSKSEQEKALHIYSALETLVKKYNLEGFTVRCFDLLSVLKTSSCLAFAHINDEGIIATCEGDVPTMISMLMVKDILNQKSFQCNPSRIDLDSKKIVLAHCTIPLSMCSSYDLDTHYESGIGIGVKGELNLGDVTIFKIDNELKRFMALEGEIVRNLNEPNLCRTQVEVSLPKGIEYFLTKPLSNHHLIIYGHKANELRNQLTKLGLKEVTIK